MDKLIEKQTQLDDDLRGCVERRFKDADLMRFSFADDVIDMLTEMSDGYGGEIDTIDDINKYGAEGNFLQFIFDEDARDFYSKHAIDIESFIEECEDEYGMQFNIKRPHYYGAIYLMLDLVISRLYFQLEDEGCFE